MDSVRECLVQWSLFGLSSLTSFGLDVACFSFLYDYAIGEGGQGRLLFSVVGARVISLVYNFLFNRFLVFKAGGETSILPHFARYLMLAVVIMFSSYLFTNLFLRVVPTQKVVYVKIAVDFALFIVSYVVQRTLVFVHREDGGMVTIISRSNEVI